MAGLFRFGRAEAWQDSNGNPATVALNADGSVPVASQPAGGSLTDRSSTIQTGGQDQTLASANPSRKCFSFQNLSSDDLYLNFGAAASAGAGSFQVPAGAIFTMSGGFVSTQAIHVYGATTGQAYTAKEG